MVDVAVAPPPHLLRHELVDPHDQHVLVVRAVEDPDVPVRAARSRGCARGSRARAPRRSAALKRRHQHALRVHAAEDVLDRAVLAAGVHRLEDDEQRLLGLRVQPLLEAGELAGQLRQLRGRLLLVAGRAVGGPRVAVGEGEVLAGAGRATVRRRSRSLRDPGVAVAIEVQVLGAVVGDHAEDGLVVLGARPVDDLHELQLADLGVGALGERRAAASSSSERSQPLSQDGRAASGGVGRLELGVRAARSARCRRPARDVAADRRGRRRARRGQG